MLLDDETARTEARRLGMRVKGTLGVLVSAFRGSLLTYDQVEVLFTELGMRPDIWISERLCQHVLESLTS